MLYAPVAVSNWYPALTCGSLKLVFPSGHTPGNRHDRRAKQVEGLRCCVCLHTRYVCFPSPVLALSRPPCPSSSPFPTPLPSPLLLLLNHLLSPPLLTLASTPPILPLSSSFPTVEKSYGEGDMQSHNRRSNRPEQRTVLVARELVRYKVDIAALSET
ncbi:unnamed protein product [Schistocephalus solidus]|uniref:Uncharacterized protein n=1 Tax=Schistocephalus solidus TaxID=70667 RepID=A0A183TCE9_SCHSO|nr:unnamed protein product [Schistocephalus solidus]